MATNLQNRFKELSDQLLEQMNQDGFWTGELSSSALGVAVAIAALHFENCDENHKEISKGLDWLLHTINDDGSYGDTPDSEGNISTTLLVYAAVNLYAREDHKLTGLQKNMADYLLKSSIDVTSNQVSKAILAHYKKDYTFSVPILTMCALCGIPGKNAFKYIPQLPFELALLPRKFYRMLNLSVVSYAIPALVAVGVVIFKKKSSNKFWHWIRKNSVKKALSVLIKLVPESGGFLEAIPLTAFVSLSLINAGYKDMEVVQKGIAFLKRAQRNDGSWPIDIDLSTWVTSLSIKALRTKLNDVLTTAQKDKLTEHLKAVQNKKIHPFNGTGPGGWGWTNFSGSVPDGDDTPGVILALLQLQPKEKIKNEVLAGGNWLLKLQNNDGGFPTFSKGWGKLPFDQSCADLTGHNLLAISTLIGHYGNELKKSRKRAYIKSFSKALKYLQKQQQPNGSWLPLWFGNQGTADHTNPVYGTARVLTYMNDILLQNWLESSLKNKIQTIIDSGVEFLLKIQNKDGSWGGGESVPGSMEETALAVSAMLPSKNTAACQKGFEWLGQYYKQNSLKPAPIGLYFASLWYSEKMYPLTAYLESITRISN